MQKEIINLWIEWEKNHRIYSDAKGELCEISKEEGLYVALLPKARKTIFISSFQ